MKFRSNPTTLFHKEIFNWNDIFILISKTKESKRKNEDLT